MMRAAGSIALLVSPFCLANADGMDMVQITVAGRLSATCEEAMTVDPVESSRQYSGDSRRRGGENNPAQSTLAKDHDAGTEGWDTYDASSFETLTLDMGGVKSLGGLVVTLNKARNAQNTMVFVATGNNPADIVWPNSYAYGLNVALESDRSIFKFADRATGKEQTVDARYIRIRAKGARFWVGALQCGTAANCGEHACPSGEVTIIANAASTDVSDSNCCQDAGKEQGGGGGDVCTTNDWDAAAFSQCNYWGDPHFRNSFVNPEKFDFHASGVFKLAATTDGAFEAQMFSCMINGNLAVSLAVAIKVDGQVTIVGKDDSLAAPKEVLSGDQCERVSVQSYNWGTRYYQGVKLRVAAGTYAGAGICGSTGPWTPVTTSTSLFGTVELTTLCGICGGYGQPKPAICLSEDEATPAPTPPVEPVTPDDECKICTTNSLDCDKAKTSCATCESAGTTEYTQCVEDYCASENEAAADESTDNCKKEKERKACTPACEVTLYQHWHEGAGAGTVTGATKTLKCVGEHPLAETPAGVLTGEGPFPWSTVKVSGEGCVAYGHKNVDCSGDKGKVVASSENYGNDNPNGVVGPDFKVMEHWGCNDCIKCVRIEHTR